jgi:hypothetical protein
VGQEKEGHTANVYIHQQIPENIMKTAKVMFT